VLTVTVISAEKSSRAVNRMAPIIRAVNIYLACTVRGDRGAVMALRDLAANLERDGHVVLTRHLLDDAVDAAEAALSERQVFERDLRWLTAADILIADASGSSYGVGFEVGYLLGLSERSARRVLVLYNAGRQEHVSRLITGNTHPACVTYAYGGADDLVAFVHGFLAEVAARS
jgi:nucleoside 2-deoxyribosyltransferase